MTDYTKYSRYLPFLADFDDRAIRENFIRPTDRTAIDSAILGLVGPRSTTKHALLYLNSLNT